MSSWMQGGFVMRFKNRRWGVMLVVAGLFVIGLCLAQALIASAYTEKQADLGASTFAFYCSTCHGDRGQGLTDAWRATWAPGDQNCWTPKCHGPRHPPGGFVIPRDVPAVIGPGTLPGEETALDLYNFIKAEMPYQDPSLLTETERWALTAFLVREHGVSADGIALDANTAAAIRLKLAEAPAALPTWVIASPVPHIISLAASPSPSATPSPLPPATPSPVPLAPVAPASNANWIWIVVIGVALVGGGLALMRLRRSR
jgi:mono/diheme cytochrome c family protein